LNKKKPGKNKIVIRKDKASPSVKLTAGNKKSLQKSLTSEINLQADKNVQDNKQAKKNKSSKSIFIIVSLIMFVLVAAIVSNLIIVNKKEKERQRIEFFELKNARDNSTASCAEINANSEKIVSIIAKIKKYEKPIRDSVLLVTDTELTLEDIAAPVEAVPHPAAETNEVSKADNAETAPSENTAKTEAASPPATNLTDKAVAATASATNTVKGVKPAVNDTKPEVINEKQKDKIVFNPDNPVFKLTRTKDDDLPPITVLGRNTVINIHKVYAINKLMQEILEESKAVDSCTQNEPDSNAAKERNIRLKRMAKISSIYAERVKAMYTYIKESNAEIIEITKTFTAEQERKKLAEIKAEKEKEEQERKQRELEEYNQLSEAEVNQVQIDLATIVENSSQNDFDGIAAGLKKNMAGYKTARGKLAIRNVINRYKQMALMQKELISCINKNPFPWGWGFGSSARDIVSADEKGVRIKGSGAIHPWSGIAPPQMLKLVDHYLESRETRASSQSNLAMGAAVYCDESIAGVGEKIKPKVKAKAKSYMHKAINYGFNRSKAEDLMGEDYL
jgi:hypothetical protein